MNMHMDLNCLPDDVWKYIYSYSFDVNEIYTKLKRKCHKCGITSAPLSHICPACEPWSRYLYTSHQYSCCHNKLICWECAH